MGAICSAVAAAADVQQIIDGSYKGTMMTNHFWPLVFIQYSRLIMNGHARNDWAFTDPF